MEGNFYLSKIVINQKLKSKLGTAYAKCAREAENYAKCVEKAHANNALKKDCCGPQRMDLDSCVRRAAKNDWPPKSA